MWWDCVTHRGFCTVAHKDMEVEKHQRDKTFFVTEKFVFLRVRCILSG